MDASRQAIIDMASEWFARARDRELSQLERREFARWLKESPVHVEEYLAITRLWGDVGQLNELPAAACEPASAGAVGNVVELAGRSENHRHVQDLQTGPGHAMSPPWGRRRRAAAGASFVAFALLAGLGWWHVDDSAENHVTARGEQRSLVLEDGTVVELNTSSEIRVDYNASARNVTLVRGEGFFDVQEDASRPFVVRAGDSEIRVHGTRFNVYMQMRETTVTVLEGNVTVLTALASEDHEDSVGAINEADPVDESGGLGVTLVGGEQAIIDNETNRISTAPLSNLEQAVAWTDRRLVFDDSRLDQILSEFARYNDFNYVISGDGVATLKFTGVFDTQDPESFISYLEFHADVSISRENGVVVVSSSP